MHPSPSPGCATKATDPGAPAGGVLAPRGLQTHAVADDDTVACTAVVLINVDARGKDAWDSSS
ncbi:hypothetical protein EON66_10120 [archaeon]|nr:MAG: hypothetical protein EON66_10120 [archaeon]